MPKKNNSEAKTLTTASVSSASSSPTTTSVSETSLSSNSVSGGPISSIPADSDSVQVPILSSGDAALASPYLSPEEEDRQSGDIASFEIDLGSLPYSVHKFCQEVGMDPAVVVENLLLDAYQEILYTLAEEDARDEVKSRLRRVVENEYVMGRISSDALEKARRSGWLQDSDVEAIKRLRENFRVLLDEPSGS